MEIKYAHGSPAETKYPTIASIPTGSVFKWSHPSEGNLICLRTYKGVVNLASPVQTWTVGDHASTPGKFTILRAHLVIEGEE